MRNIHCHYVDLGAHWGEALEEALKPVYGFETLYAVEPSKMAIKNLHKFRDPRLRVENWGAWNENGLATLHSAGSVGASLFPDKNQHWQRAENVELRDILYFFNNTFQKGDAIYLKVNIEGAELTVLKHLLEGRSSGWKIASILLSVDIPKVPSLRNSESEIWKLLADNGIPFRLRSHRFPNHAVRAWLQEEIIIEKKISPMKRFLYLYRLPMHRLGRLLLMRFIPVSIWVSLAKRFGPNRATRFPTTDH